MRRHAAKQLTQLLQTAAHTASSGPPQKVPPVGVYGLSPLTLSAALGDQQVPWDSALLQAFRAAYCTLAEPTPSSSSSSGSDGSRSGNDNSDTRNSSGSSPAVVYQQPAAPAQRSLRFRNAIQRLSEQQIEPGVQSPDTTAPTQATPPPPPAAASAPTPALNFDDQPDMLSKSGQQQRQHQQVIGLKPAPKVKKLKSKPFQVPAEVLSALQVELASTHSNPHSISSSSPISSSVVALMLPSIVDQHQELPVSQTKPNPSYDELVQYDRLRLSGQPGSGSSSSRPGRLTEQAYGVRFGLLKRFGSRGLLRLMAMDYGIQMPKQLGPLAVEAFRRFMGRSATPGLTAAVFTAAVYGNAKQLVAEAVGASAVRDASAEGREVDASAMEAGLAVLTELGVDVSYNAAVEALLLPYFVEFVKRQYKQEIETYAAQVSTLDLRSPHTWYPYARAIKRKIIYHGGPTNSGKTYNALQSLASAARGVYCAPLRLLAMEVYEALNHRGVYCDLVTGQEVLKVPGSCHVSCTAEMAALNTHADVAIIDEIQLIGDEQRGFAWTRALLGLPANVIHVCGDTSAVALVQHMAKTCGDDFELHTYERMTPLTLDHAGLPNGWEDVQAGDAVVAFSRKNIYKARGAIEAATGQRTCIVYGALPAETRRHQARLFNDPQSDVNILVASDAIGLGLNFNIRRVIFTSLHKRGFMGRGAQPVSPSLIKQIAGRAGRRNSIYPAGCVTTFSPRDMPILKRALELPVDRLHTPAAGLAPEYETIELLSAQLPDLNLEHLLRKLDSEARLDGKYFLCNQRQMLETASVLGMVKGLSLADQFTLINAPLDAYDERQRRSFLDFTNTYAAGHPVVFNEGLMPVGPPTHEWQMNEAESLHKIMALWLWLSYRFEEGTFPGREKVQNLARTISHWLNIGLDNIQASLALKSAQAVLSKPAVADDDAGSESVGVPVDSSDADEINESVFITPVVQESSGAAAVADEDLDMVSSSGAVDNVSTGTASHDPADAAHLSNDRSQLASQQQQQKQQWGSARTAARVPVTYINWGSAISLGLAQLSPNDNGSSSEDDADVVGSPATEAMMSETSFAAGTAHSVEVLEHLMMPEFEPSMGRFITWKSRPRFIVPPRPRHKGEDTESNREGAYCTDNGV